MLLCAISNVNEIKQTLFSLGSDKSPGSDGMPALFYKHYWKVINQDLIEAVTSFFTRGHILTEINHTFITLIPKSDKASKISFPGSSNELNQLVLCKASKSLLAAHRFHIYNLQMTSSFSQKQTPQMQPPFLTA
ncbi:putative mitochondrial protein [Fagus crenata]